MSVNRNMKRYMLQENQPTKSPSGAQKEKWVDVKNIDAAIYKKNDMKLIASEVYKESTHTGLTYCKDIRAYQYRLIGSGKVYDITDCNQEGRLTNLLLRVVEKND